MNDRIYLLEIKNYTDDFYYDSDRFLKKDGSEISNPLTQLQRTESLLRQLLLNNNFQIPIQSSVIFINPEFTLYQAPLNMPFIFPSQLNRFFQTLNAIPSNLNERHKKIADKLIALRSQEHPLQQYPTYSYQDLQKGIKCAACENLKFSPTNHCRGMEVVCLNCGKSEQLESALIRTFREFQILFPKEKNTTKKMYEWCNLEVSQKTIRRILKKHFTKHGTNRWIYYT